eukprot:5904296-Pyramimonas_sp.AAC.1
MQTFILGCPWSYPKAFDGPPIARLDTGSTIFGRPPLSVLAGAPHAWQHKAGLTRATRPRENRARQPE